MTELKDVSKGNREKLCDNSIGGEANRMNCRCGRPAFENDTFCARCRYYQNVFNPPILVFESKRERALKAITMKRMMRNSSKVMVIG